MAAVQQRDTLRVACFFQTVLKPVVLQVTGVMLVDLLAKEQKQIFEMKSKISKACTKLKVRAYSCSVGKNDGIMVVLRQKDEPPVGVMTHTLASCACGSGFNSQQELHWPAFTQRCDEKLNSL